MNKYITKLKQMSRSILVILLLVTSNLYAQNLTDDQKNAFMPNIKRLLKDYEQYSQFTTDGIRLNNDYIIQFSTLFNRKIKNGIYNDITPTNKGIFHTVDEYVSFVRSNYPQGLDVTIDIDNIQIEEAYLKKTVFEITVKVHKKITGLFNNQKIHHFNDDLFFTLTATADAQGKPSDFKINGILNKSRYAQTIINRQGKGVFVGITGLYALTQIYSPMSFSSDILEAKSGNSFYPGIDLLVMFTNSFGLGTGIRFSSYKSSFNISSYNKTSDAVITDIDGDTYNPVLQINNLNQVSTVKSLDIPILLKFRGGKNKTKFYFDLGVIYTKISNATFTLTGNSVRKGYYSAPYYVTLSDIPEYGFGSYTYRNDEFNLMTESSTFSGYTSFGLMFQLPQNLLLKIGGSLTYGLSDLKPDNNNTDNYINLVSSKPVENTTLRAISIEMGIFYKIPF